MTATAVPFELVETKLAAPLIRQGTVARAEVIEQLRVARLPVVTVVAPAGYGKTTLLAHWAEVDPRPFAWHAVDGRDDDGVVFLRYIAAAIHGVEPVAGTVFQALSGPGASTWATRVTHVGSAFARLEQALVLVLDDLHAIENPECLDALAALVEYVPAGSQVVVASRDEPALPLPRWRTQGRLHEVGVAELRLDSREAAQLLQAAGVELDDAVVADLTARTEGWPAGLYLAALSMRAGGPSGTRAFSGDDRFVAEYLHLELLTALPDPQARFLTRTSVLERMSGSLCDAVLETTGSAQTLEALSHANGFVVPLDRRGEWYRYHHLFREMLRNELQRQAPEAVAILSRRAMEWCIAHEQPETAVVYGHAAGAMDVVVNLIDKLALHVYWDGRLETASEWLGWVDDDDLIRYPGIVANRAYVSAFNGRSAEAERWLSLAERGTSAMPLGAERSEAIGRVATLRAYLLRDGLERALADVNLGLEQLAEGSFRRPGTYAIRGMLQTLAGDTESARADLVAAVELGRLAGSWDDVFSAQAQLALLSAREGAWGEAGQHARDAQELVEKVDLGDYTTSAIVHAATARVALHEGRQEEARAALARAHRLRPLLNEAIPWLTVQVGLELARVHLALAEAAAARTVLREVEAVLERRPDLGTLIDDTRELRERVAATSGPEGAWAMSLTGAELRLLPYLATHLTFPEIGSRLFVSRNTIKSEAVSIYHKLGASTRSEAVERAVDVGLLDSSARPPSLKFTPEV